MSDVSVGVIGLGSMGTNHARVLEALAGARLCGVADPDSEARATYRAPAGVRVHADYRALLDEERPDAVIVAVPPELHREIACAAIERGVHVLVEKPLAKRVEDAGAIVTAARARGVKLMVGHVERYNPAVVELKRRVRAGDLGQIYQLHARRLLPVPARMGSVGVALDLASHDIDAMRFVTGSRVERAYAETARRAGAASEDMLSGLLRFSRGEIGVLDVSWLTRKSLRELSVVGERGTLVVDYLAQRLHALGPSGADEIALSDATRSEPLRAELAAFVACIRDDLASPVSGEDGLAAVEIALDLIASGLSGRPISRGARST